MANSRQLAEASLCLNCCICCLQTVLLTSQWTLFCQRWLGSSVLSWASDSVSSTCVSPLKGHRDAAVCVEHETPLLEAEDEDTKCSFLSLWGMCVLSETCLQYVCVLGAQSSVPLHFSFARQFQQDYYCSLVYQVWQTCQCFIFRAGCPEILAYCPLEHKTDWTDVSDTLCDASATDPVCVGYNIEGLKWDCLTLLLRSPEKMASLFSAIIRLPSHAWYNKVFMLL